MRQTIMCRTCDGDGAKDGAICPVCHGSTIEHVYVDAPARDDRSPEEKDVAPTLKLKKKKKRKIA